LPKNIVICCDGTGNHFELATGFWLVIKGLRPEKTTADRARAGITA
jgi:hypothetical protein